MPDTDKAALTSAGSVLRLVKLMAERGSLRVTQAAYELGVPPSTSWLLALMVHSGFAVHEADRAYLPGPAFVRLSLAPTAPDTLRILVRSHLEQTVKAVRRVRHLMVREGPCVRFLLSAEGPGALRVASREGALLPAHKTSGGKALLAELSNAELAEMLGQLWPELRAVRRQGFAINKDQSEVGISAVGVVLRHRSSAAVAAISMRDRPCGSAMRRCARWWPRCRTPPTASRPACNAVRGQYCRAQDRTDEHGSARVRASGVSKR